MTDGNDPKQERAKELYLRQKELLDTFLSRGAISRAQYEKSLGDLTEKMGMAEILAAMSPVSQNDQTNNK